MLKQVQHDEPAISQSPFACVCKEYTPEKKGPVVADRAFEVLGEDA